MAVGHAVMSARPLDARGSVSLNIQLGGVMNWKQEVDALIESTMAFVKDVQREPVALVPVAAKAAEQALSNASKLIPAHAILSQVVRPPSERDEIRQRIADFKAHQQKLAREREDYYLQTKAKMLAMLAKRP